MSDNILMYFVGIGGLFDFDVDGDVGVDPNYMTLWFSQPGLGLPSKVRTSPSTELRFDALIFFRNTTKKRKSFICTNIRCQELLKP